MSLIKIIEYESKHQPYFEKLNRQWIEEYFEIEPLDEALSKASFTKAQTLGISKIVLYSNTKNAAAIKLYEKIGFKHLPVENDVYKRANVKMIMELKDLAQSSLKKSLIKI